jgi:hypothetical protein
MPFDRDSGRGTLLQRWQVSPFFAGCVLGIGAAVIQGYFKVIPPVAYGVCMVCHPKDLLNWIAAHTIGVDWEYSIASIQAPLLTVPGVLAGSWFAASRNGELRIRPSHQPVLYFTCGFITINLGLVLGSCPIRLVLLAAYGNPKGIVEWLLVVIGVVGGTLVARLLARWRAKEML